MSDDEPSPANEDEAIASEPRPVSPPNPNVRRSARTTRPPARYTSFLCLALLCLFLPPIENYSLDRATPLVWKSDKAVLLKGIKTVALRVDYESPCKLLGDFYNNLEYRSAFLEWCNRKVREDFIDPFLSYCSPKDIPSTKNSTRKKRAIFALAIGSREKRRKTKNQPSHPQALLEESIALKETEALQLPLRSPH